MKVIKLGGSLLDDPQRRGAALAKIVEAWRGGEPVVLVHGGGKHIDALTTRLGMTKQVVRGLRVTDDATLQVVVAVLSRTGNKLIVSDLSPLAVPAFRISCADAGTVTAIPHIPLDG